MLDPESPMAQRVTPPNIVMVNVHEHAKHHGVVRDRWCPRHRQMDDCWTVEPPNPEPEPWEGHPDIPVSPEELQRLIAQDARNRQDRNRR